MEGPESAANTGSDLATLLTTFEALTSHDKAEALQHIIRTQRGEAVTSCVLDIPLASPATPPSDAHSCYICTQFAVTQKLEGESEEYFTSNKVRLSKETLTQGLAQKCLLVEWIFTLLARGLHDLKSIVRAKGTHVFHVKTSRDAAEDLQYISVEGVTLQFHGYGGDSDEVTVLLQYEPDPFLVDRLWMAAFDLHDYTTYEDFERKYDGNVDGSFRRTAAADDPAALDCRFRPATDTVEPESMLELARKFLNHCQDRHEKCYRNVVRLPSRVIDIGTKLPIRSVRLHWSEEGETGQYAALSYCWGGHQPMTSRTTTAQEMTNGLLFSQLPRTLQDAMIVTIKLGLRYIWIDSLCILQDDMEDLNREISRMAETFHGAFVTISAASAANVNLGFLFERTAAPRPRIAVPYRSPNVKSGALLIEQPRTAYDTTIDPINLRAWTLQEHILSRRTLIFGTKELWWSCESAINFDSLPTKRDELVPIVQRKSGSDRFSLGYWRLIVRDYTRRFLTYPNDKLSAIAGVADLYSQFFDNEYLAGLWGKLLLSELMWCSCRSDITRPLVQRAPSWSWASIDGEIHHDWCPLDPGPDAPNIIECHVSPASQSSLFGPIDPTRCVLRIQGLLIKAIWQEDRRYISISHMYRRFDQRRGQAAYSRAGRTHADALENTTSSDVWFLPITLDPFRGLLLVHVKDDVYRRVGLVSRLWADISLPTDDERQTISII